MEEELTGKGVDLPPEIMHDILSRLPAKPLCRFKSVSKPWLSLISNTNFITMHSKAVETNENVLFQRRRVLFTNTRSSRHFSLDLDQFLEDVDAPVITRLRFHQRPILTLSCNALLLIETMTSDSTSELCLVNPLDMRPKQLPGSFEAPFMWSHNAFGLGFDYSNNEYKVVHLEVVSCGFTFNVYTLKTDSWRHVARLSLFSKKPKITRRERLFFCDDKREGVLVNGCVHWLRNWFKSDRVDSSENTCVSILIEDTKCGDRRIFSADGPLIVGFMITKEKIVTIRLPRMLVRVNGEEMELGVFRDCLCVTFLTISRQGVQSSYNDFWVMKEYGVEESWTKMRVSIPYYSLSHTGFWRGSYDLMKINTDNKTSSLVMYNFDDEEDYWALRIQHKGCDFRYNKVVVYVETLASVSSVITSSQSSRKRKRKSSRKRLCKKVL